MPATPEAWISGATAAHRRIEALIQNLTDAQARGATRLPDWTVGHLLTHLARNADANAGMAQAAQRGEIGKQYPGGTAQREGDIAAGQGRSAAELVADLKGAQQRLEAAWAETSEDAWRIGLAQTTQAIRALAHTALLRWREAEVHLADLGLGADWDGLSAEYVNVEWAEITANLPRRAPEGKALFLIPGDRPSRVYGAGPDVVRIEAPSRRILQYLLGRGGEPGWPDLGAWG